MRSFIIGTAGHIDHGKSALVKALTGTDPDRLKEEKERGITIELGFAHAPLSDDVIASFVDVPGHEKFVRHMLAGASGIDAVMLVIDANEGVMPQTREHFHICRLLGIKRGLIALTKVDAAEPKAIDAAEWSARELTRDSFLESAPMVRVSARTGEGMGALKTALLTLAKDAGERAQTGIFRLPIDRVFTLRGFGTVVTGTLMGGVVRAGEELVVLPSEKKARVRSVQVHGERVDIAMAGQRTALNLTGVQVEELERGDVVIRESSLRGTRVAHVALTLLKTAALKNGARVRVHAGSAEAFGRVRFSADEIHDGPATLAEIRLESPVVLARNDRLVIRSYSPAETIGGAIVLDPLPRPRRRAELAALESIASETDDAAASRFLKEEGVAGLEVRTLAARMGCLPEPARLMMVDCPGAVRLPGVSETFVDQSVMAALEASVLDRLRVLHSKDPLAKGLSKEELRRRVFNEAADGAFEAVLLRLTERHLVSESTESVALTSHRVRLSGPDDVARLAVEHALEGAGLKGVWLPSLHTDVGQSQKGCENAVRVLVQEKVAERLGAGLLVARAALDGFREEARARFVRGAPLDVAEVKELTGLSRKYVIPLLEWLDRERVTRRVGASRIVL